MCALCRRCIHTFLTIVKILKLQIINYKKLDGFLCCVFLLLSSVSLLCFGSFVVYLLLIHWMYLHNAHHIGYRSSYNYERYCRAAAVTFTVTMSSKLCTAHGSLVMECAIIKLIESKLAFLLSIVAQSMNIMCTMHSAQFGCFRTFSSGERSDESMKQVHIICVALQWMQHREEGKK